MRRFGPLKIAGFVAMGLAAAVAMAVVLGFPVMWLWNWLAPELFHLPTIDFWHAVGLLALCHLLFKSHGMGGHGPGRRRHGRRWSRFAEDVQGTMRTRDSTPDSGPVGP